MSYNSIRIVFIFKGFPYNFGGYIDISLNNDSIEHLYSR
ncbi:hypothetical protein MARI151_60130 [Maribacter litoralis]|uniref:Uncharacterized protein n=1 Tax=Maribacter litoralis TaxID=2059726 RepID=A0A653W3X1_9FLAO|nr:hypothetical protein MARI151_60130 [Maribacter litoralis]